MKKKAEDPKLRRMREYATDRLRRELQSKGRGGQAEVARELEISTAHMSNILSEDHPALPGMELLRMMAKRWGLTADQLEAEALGRKGPSLPEDVHPLIEQAADRRATTRDVAVDASRIWFRTGREDLSEEEALELVDLVLGTHRFAVRLGKPGSGEHRLALANATAEKRVIRGPKR